MDNTVFFVHAYLYLINKYVATLVTQCPDFVTYITYAVFMVATVGQVGVLFGRLKQGAAMYIKHQHRFEAPLENLSSTTQTNSDDKLGIEFDNVSFSYPPHHSKILKNLNVGPNWINIILTQSESIYSFKLIQNGTA